MKIISNNLKRPFVKNRRSNFWKNIANKYGRKVEILVTSITKSEAIDIEIGLIKYYGRLDINTGSLCNLTNGGELGVIGAVQTKEHKSKRSLNNPNKTPVVQLSTNNESLNTYHSIREAQRITGICRKCISKVCNNKRKTAGGYIWKFL